MTKTNKEKLAIVEIDCLRRSCQISQLDHVRNEVIREQAKIKEGFNRIEC